MQTNRRDFIKTFGIATVCAGKLCSIVITTSTVYMQENMENIVTLTSYHSSLNDRAYENKHF